MAEVESKQRLGETKQGLELEREKWVAIIRELKKKLRRKGLRKNRWWLFQSQGLSMQPGGVGGVITSALESRKGGSSWNSASSDTRAFLDVQSVTNAQDFLLVFLGSKSGTDGGLEVK